MLYLDHCLKGFPNIVVFEGSSRRGEQDRVTTRLFPNMKFGCSGTIVRVTAAVHVRYPDTRNHPKFQIWRENDTQPGLYHKIDSKLLITWPDPPCYQSSFSRGIYQCTLKDEDRISVQPGDFLGLEIVSTNNDDPEVYFKAGGPTKLVFQSQLNPTVNLSTELHTVAYDEPQVTFLLVIGIILSLYI